MKDSSGPSVDRSESLPLYYQVYQYILRQLIPHHPAGDPLPSDDTVAAATQVSKGTVRLAFNLLEREGLLYRIPGRGTFLREDYLLRLKRYAIGVVLPPQEFSDRVILIQNWVHHMEMINGLFGAESRLNVTCTLLAPDSLLGARGTDFDGFILYPGVVADDLRLAGRPWVFLDYAMDFLAAFDQMTSHAVSSGCRLPAYIGYTHEGRLQTVEARLASFGLAPLSDAAIVRCEGSVEDGYRACSELLARGLPFDLILCSTDLRALGVLRRLAEVGLRVPEQVAVYGIDGIPQGEGAIPPLTTFAFDWQYTGRRALEQIRAVLDGLPPPGYQKPQGTLVERASSRRSVGKAP